jgi:phenylacetaldehyde dehydrogenase
MISSHEAQFGRARAFLEREHGVFIDGGWCTPQSDRRLPVVDPANGKTIAHIAACENPDVDRAVDSARRSFADGRWRRTKPAQRRDTLLRVADLIDAHGAELAYLECLDNGKPLSIALTKDVPNAASMFRYYAGYCDKVHGTSNRTSAPGESHGFTLREPVGVAALIVPWNLPIGTAAKKLAPALAAGCSCVLKPAEETSLTALRLVELLLEAGVPAGVVNLVTGIGGSAGAALSAHKGVDKITFTGSTEVGKQIVCAASGNLKRVTLELGGKAPNIVFPDADLQQAIAVTTAGAFNNAGQNCIALSRLMVHRDVHDEVVAGIVANTRRIIVGAGLNEATTMGPLISARQRDRVLQYIAIGSGDGATIEAGGGTIDSPGFFVQPTVFSGCRPDMRIVREEIFGPVLTIEKFDNIATAIASANDSDYGLSATLWTRDLSLAHRMVSELRYGGIGVNSGSAADRDLPFGGFRQSGWGRENAFEGLSAYLETKSVVIRWGD